MAQIFDSETIMYYWRISGERVKWRVMSVGEEQLKEHEEDAFGTFKHG